MNKRPKFAFLLTTTTALVKMQKTRWKQRTTSQKSPLQSLLATPIPSRRGLQLLSPTTPSILIRHLPRSHSPLLKELYHLPLLCRARVRRTLTTVSPVRPLNLCPLGARLSNPPSCSSIAKFKVLPETTPSYHQLLSLKMLTTPQKISHNALLPQTFCQTNPRLYDRLKRARPGRGRNLSCRMSSVVTRTPLRPRRAPAVQHLH